MVEEFGDLLFVWVCCPVCRRRKVLIRWWSGRKWCEHDAPSDPVPAFARVRLDRNKRAHLPKVVIRT